MTKNRDITGLILAGGRGARMGGVNKALVVYQGRHLYEYSVENLSQHVASIMINSNTDHGYFQKRGFRVVDDGNYPYRGPLAGIYAGMLAATTPFVAIAPCDQLVLPEHVYTGLIDEARHFGGAYAIHGADSHPTCAVLSVDFADSIQHCLENNQYRLGLWMKQQATPVEFASVAFANINTLPEE